MESTDADRYDETGREVSGSGEQHSGQVRMAYRLAGSHHDRLLHVHGIGWHVYDGTRWRVDHKGAAQRAVLEVLQAALSESLGDKQLRADVARCESSAGIEGVLSIAAALVEFAATVHDLDADPHLLNCANGTVDLRTMELLPHSPPDRLSKIARGAYRPDVTSSEWDRFLSTSLPDVDERAYLQRVIGQSLYGRVTEHLFPVLIGEGGNGKGTFYGAVTSALGGYATVINPSMLMKSKRGTEPGPELMVLLGTRLAVGSETSEGQALDEATMKRLSGGDELTGRYLFKDPVTWQPTHQLLYVTNHKPKVKGDSAAVWRRLRVIPFDVIVSPEERVDGLDERLELCADAILSWAVAGYVDYKANGMREPSSVVNATDEYRAESDHVARFVSEDCIRGDGHEAMSGALFAAWQMWAGKEGVDPGPQNTFLKALDRLGFHAGKRRKAGVPRLGLSLMVSIADDRT